MWFLGCSVLLFSSIGLKKTRHIQEPVQVHIKKLECHGKVNLFQNSSQM